MNTAPTHNPIPTPCPTAAERQARRNASAKLGWCIHLMVYAAVNAGLALLMLAQGRDLRLGPLLGWGFGLALHGLWVWLNAGPGLYDWLLRRERARLQEGQRHAG